MSILNLQASYFSIENPLRLVDRWLNRYSYRKTVQINQRSLELRWTERAERELGMREQALIVELQLYFSCVVKKRVLFHQRVDFATNRVDNRLEMAFHAIASAVCDPNEFAQKHPEGRDLSSGPAARMVPAIVEIDYRAGRWQGQFRDH
jgi:hypothetical protein